MALLFYTIYVMDNLNNLCLAIIYWNRIWVILAVVMSHFSIYSTIVNVSFLCVCFHTVGPTVFHLQRSGSISVSVLLFLPCFECLVDSAANPWCFISSHVTYTRFFSARPLQHPQSLPHIYSSFGQCEMLDAWDFLKHTTFAMLIVVCLFRPETRTKRQNKQHFGHAQAHTPDERCFTLELYIKSNFYIHVHIPFGSFHHKKIKSILSSCGL